MPLFRSLWVAVGGLTACAMAPWAWAQFDPARVRPEPPEIARHFAAPAAAYGSPAFGPGRSDFPSHAEVLAFLGQLAKDSPRVRVSVLGLSQRGLPTPLVELTGPAGYRADLPTVLVLGQQHGNEPAGGEGALALAQTLAKPPHAQWLERVNVLILPRANPDGAERFGRVTASGIDVNRDHLLLRTPEARWINSVANRYRPQVVLDLHEFTVAGRWVSKFGAVQKYDALLQPATVGNLSAAIQRAQGAYITAVRDALGREGQSVFWYHTTSDDPQDRQVAMGGVQPDTGRNVGGLRNAVSLLIETRGVGLGRQHLARRVHAHVTAGLAVVRQAATEGQSLLAITREADAEVSAWACNGDLVVAATHTPTRQELGFLDARSGEPRDVEVAWRDAFTLQVEARRPRPCGYLVGGDQSAALERLQALGVQMVPVAASPSAQAWVVERYKIESSSPGQRQDARGAIDDGAPIHSYTVTTEPTRIVPPAGSVYVPLAQALGALAGAALEPDSQSSFAASGILDLRSGSLWRVMQLPP